MDKKIPTYEVIANYFNESPLGLFECPCGVRHRHGLPSQQGEPEHRVAHCHDSSLHPNGYYIVWNGKKDGVRRNKKLGWVIP
jgi:hypothetical protein